mmetsp:Transcript_36098/g.81440  ORF Transcript_36098/g.81440 Transcript_36098/m.81440 type:complete len:751 (-) Transcript_36098:143-2395(-)
MAPEPGAAKKAQAKVRAAKKKKNKENQKARKAAHLAQKQEPQTKKKPTQDDNWDIEYVPDAPAHESDPVFAAMRSVFQRFEVQEEEEEEPEDDAVDPNKRRRNKEKLRAREPEEESDDDEMAGLSRKRRKEMNRMSVAMLKSLVRRPDVVEVWDTHAPDPRHLVFLKAYRNTVTVPRHWSHKRRYMAGKRGVEKPPFKLPEYIEATGIAKIRQAIMEKESSKGLRAKARDKVRPKVGKLDIDHQVLHDAFFKYQTKPKGVSRHGEMYYEGKEYEVKMSAKKPGQLSEALRLALGMGDNHPPPWLYNMQRYGPPPAYPALKIPGLNAPIPFGAEYGYHAGGWGKPPVDEFGNPLYGDWAHGDQQDAEEDDEGLWGELDDDDESEEDMMNMGPEGDGTATPAVGTPMHGADTPLVSLADGSQSISGVSSMTSGMDTPESGSMRRRDRGLSSSGMSSATLTPTPQLFQILEEQKAPHQRGALFPSQHGYKVGQKSRRPGGASSMAGVATPLGGIATQGGIGTPLGGIATPLGGIATPLGGIATPLGGIATPLGGIATPLGGIATPLGGIATPVGGIATPLGGIATPIGGIATPLGGLATPGAHTPGHATPHGGIATPMGGIATPIGGIATPVGGIATPLGGVATPGIGTPRGVLTPAGIATPGMATPGYRTPAGIGSAGGVASVHGGTATPGGIATKDVEHEGILTADIIRKQLKQHSEQAQKAKQAARQVETGDKKKVGDKKVKKEKRKFKF